MSIASWMQPRNAMVHKIMLVPNSINAMKGIEYGNLCIAEICRTQIFRLVLIKDTGEVLLALNLFFKGNGQIVYLEGTCNDIICRYYCIRKATRSVVSCSLRCYNESTGKKYHTTCAAMAVYH
jgi:hypothetical protein